MVLWNKPIRKVNKAMNNVFHRLSKRELEDAVIQYLASNGRRDDLVTILINNECDFSLSDEGGLDISKEEK